MVRPFLFVVHWARSGQSAQASPNWAVPSASRLRRIVTVTPYGQVTLSSSRSMSKSDLVNMPSAATGSWVLHRESMSLRSRNSWNSPVVYGDNAYGTGEFQEFLELAGAVGVVAVHHRPVAG